MPAEIIDGRKIATSIERELKRDASDFASQYNIAPSLVVIVVGEDPRSMSYIRQKTRVCARVGIQEETRTLPLDTTQEELIAQIHEINQDASIHGLLVQDPLPDHIDALGALTAMNPLKDVDGLHAINAGLVAIGAALFEPCTPKGIIALLARSGHHPSGKHVVIVGRSNLVGKPLMNMLTQKTEHANATVTVCHTGTRDIAVHIRQADILVAVAGQPEMITGDMLKPGCVVIDVGINLVDDPASEKGYRLVGDVHYESAREVAKAITPVPGGVGPMTCVMLAANTLLAARMHMEPAIEARQLSARQL